MLRGDAPLQTQDGYHVVAVGATVGDSVFGGVGRIVRAATARREAGQKRGSRDEY
eukprot:gene36400-15537_t